jgi:hypothetical protein
VCERWKTKLLRARASICGCCAVCEGKYKTRARGQRNVLRSSSDDCLSLAGRKFRVYLVSVQNKGLCLQAPYAPHYTLGKTTKIHNALIHALRVLYGL